MISTSPACGTKVAKGGTVKLYVSTGPARIGTDVVG